MIRLKPVDVGGIIERISIRKLIAVGCFSVIGCSLIAAYLIWSIPPSCDIHAIKMIGNGIITCSGEVHSADKQLAFDNVVLELASLVALQEQIKAAMFSKQLAVQTAFARQLEPQKLHIVVVVVPRFSQTHPNKRLHINDRARMNFSQKTEHWMTVSLRLADG